MTQTTVGQQVEKPAGVPWHKWARKAYVAGAAGLVGLAGNVVIAMTPDSDGGTTITGSEWSAAITLAVTTVLGAFGVYKARNRRV